MVTASCRVHVVLCVSPPPPPLPLLLSSPAPLSGSCSEREGALPCNGCARPPRQRPLLGLILHPLFRPPMGQSQSTESASPPPASRPPPPPPRPPAVSSALSSSSSIFSPLLSRAAHALQHRLDAAAEERRRWQSAHPPQHSPTQPHSTPRSPLWQPSAAALTPPASAALHCACRRRARPRSASGRRCRAVARAASRCGRDWPSAAE